MARQTTRGHKSQRASAGLHLLQQKSSKVPATQETPRRDHGMKTKGGPAMKRPMRESGAVQRAPKSKQRVSAAVVFKNKRSTGANGTKQSKRRTPTPESTPELDLADEFADGLEEARNSINTNLEASFHNVHEAFVTRLAESRSKDETFLKSISATTQTLNAPLTEEQIETTFTREGKRVTEIVRIGKSIVQFKKSIEKDEAKLAGYWAQWKELEDDFVELGVEGFGERAFPASEIGERKRGTGFRREMELLDLEHDARAKELNEEIAGIGMNVLKKVKASEKELDTNEKMEQARLLQAIFQG